MRADREGLRARKRWGLVLAVASVVVSACDDPGMNGGMIEEPTAGDVAVSVAVSGSVVLDSISYVLAGNGIAAFSGKIDVAPAGATATAAIGGVPQGLGYLVSLEAISVDGQTTCAGSGPVDVFVGQTSTVMVIMQCRGPETGGVAVVQGGVNDCPSLTSYVGAPVVVAVGGSITVSAMATDPDGNPLAYQWTAPTGTFDNPVAPMTSFTCTVPGQTTLTVAVSDGMCADSAQLPLSCVPFCGAHPDGTPCDDGDACTRTDACRAGQCLGSNPVVCAGADACHPAGACAPATGVCSHPVAPDGTSCPLPHAAAACVGGTCQLSACTGGFGDCDRMSPTGCETLLLSANGDCGACGHACLPGVSCTAGFCVSPAPMGVTAAPRGWSVGLAWSAAPGATSYEVLRAAGSGAPFVSIGTTTSTQLVDDQVATGVTYAYQVKSNSEGGTSLPSATVTTTALPKQVCVGAQAMQRILVFDATQSGRATPLRTLAGAATDLGFPQGLASNLVSGELFSSLIGGNVPVFALTASGDLSPLRVLAGAAPGQSFHALELDGLHHELFTADYDTGGAFLTLDDATGARTRMVAGNFTQLGHPASLAFDVAHDELFVGQSDPAFSYQQVLVFGRTDNGNVAPRRTLGGPDNTTVGSWSVIVDRAHDELLTTCNCNDQIAVYDRTASGDAAPKRIIEVTGLSRIYAMLLDAASDTLWIQGLGGLTTFQLQEIPRGASGATSPLRPPVLLGAAGRLARCN